MKFKKILLSLLICLSCFVQAKNITISRLTCEMQEGLVVVEGSPRLGWVMESPESPLSLLKSRRSCLPPWKTGRFYA